MAPLSGRASPYREYLPGTLHTNPEATVPPQRRNEGCSYCHEQFSLLRPENIRTGHDSEGNNGCGRDYQGS